MPKPSAAFVALTAVGGVYSFIPSVPPSSGLTRIPHVVKTCPTISSGLPPRTLPILSVSKQPGLLDRTLQKTGGASTAPPVDYETVGKWIGSTVVQFGAIYALLYGAQWGIARADVALKWKLYGVRAFFFAMSLRSRIFSPLDASRHTVATQERKSAEEKRPQWMPPPKFFPVIWTTIAFLRTLSSSLIFEYTGYLLSAPLLAFFAHLSIGDTWNHVINVRKLRGAAIPGVFTVWLSVVATTYLYWKTLPLAGKVILPSAIWITIANVLVFRLWQLNKPNEPWYPAKAIAELPADSSAQSAPLPTTGTPARDSFMPNEPYGGGNE